MAAGDEDDGGLTAGCFGSSRSKEEVVDLDIVDDEGEDRDEDEADGGAMPMALEEVDDGVSCCKNGKTPGNSTSIKRREKSVMNILQIKTKIV